MGAEEDAQPQERPQRMQMVWKQKERGRSRQLLPLKSSPFRAASGDEDDESDSVDGSQNGAKGGEFAGGHQQPASERQEELFRVRQEAELAEQAERFWTLGNSLAEEGKFGEALGKWEAAIHLTPGKAVLHEQKAQVLLEIGKFWNAVQAATCATELQPTWAEAWVTLARAQLNYGEPYLAVESAETALRLEPDHEDATIELERAQFLAIRQRQAINSAASVDEGSGLPSSRRAKVYDSQEFASTGSHIHVIAEEDPEPERQEGDALNKYDDDSYDWLDDLKRPAPQITTENFLSDFSDIL